MAHKKGKTPTIDDGGTLLCHVIEAKNLSSADIYCAISNSFNKQKFKTKVVKKSNSPNWDQTFNIFVSPPHGTIFIELWEKHTIFDDKIGEVKIGDLKKLDNGDPWQQWFTLENEPKKKKGPKGEIHVKVHYPSAKKEKEEKEKVQSDSSRAPEKPKPRRFIDNYDKGKKLGSGGFSVVYECIRKTTQEAFAVKVIAKNQSPEELNLLQREIDIMRKLKHPNIIALEEVFDEDDNIYLILELVTGGELFDQIVARGTYTEADAANLIKQILEAVAYMHEHGVAHRDLKPENLLISSPSSDSIKITDFGLSKDFGEGTLKTSCGTPDYVAPEVLKGQPYDHSVDIWSIGVITYILLCGFPPFYGNTDAQIFDKILKCQYDFPSPDWDNVSDDAKQFVSAILNLDPQARPTATDCLEAPWMQNNAPAKPLINRNQSVRLAQYNEQRKKQLASQQ